MVTALSNMLASAGVNASVRSRALGDTQFRIISGQRLLRPLDDLGATTQAVNQQAAISTFRQGLRNSAGADSQLALAQASLTRISALLEQQQSLATAATNEGLSDSERALADAQFSDLSDQIDRITEQTQFNGRTLLDGRLAGDDALAVNVGTATVTVAIADSSSAALYAGSTPSLATATDAADAVDAVETAMDRLNQTATDVSAGRTQLSDSDTSLTGIIAGLDTARGDLLNADTAAEQLRFAIESIQQQSGIAVLAQAQQLNGDLLDLVSVLPARQAPVPADASTDTATARTPSDTSDAGNTSSASTER